MLKANYKFPRNILARIRIILDLLYVSSVRELPATLANKVQHLKQQEQYLLCVGLPFWPPKKG